jgi:iron complex transport system substrate-binding protein
MTTTCDGTRNESDTWAAQRVLLRPPSAAAAVTLARHRPLEVVDEATRREFLAMLAAAGLLAACGDDGDAETDGSVQETRRVESPIGPAEIPVDPRRVVADAVALEVLVAIGFPIDRVIAGVYLPAGDDDTHHLRAAADLGDVEDLTAADFSWNVERLAALDPDLIIGSRDNLEAGGQLDDIRVVAPVVGFDLTVDWRAAVRAVAGVLGRDADGERFITETDAEIAELAERTSALGGVDVVVAEQFEGQFTVYQEGSGPGVQLLDELGVSRTEATLSLPNDGGFSPISIERIDLLDGDLLFFNRTYSDPDLDDDPLWSALPVVAEGRVIDVGSHWTYGSALAVGAVLADVRRGLEELEDA